MRTIDERDERQQALRTRLRNDDPGSPVSTPESQMLTLNECARLMSTSYATVRRLFRREPDVIVMRTPGSRKPIIRVPRSVYLRVLERTGNR